MLRGATPALSLNCLKIGGRFEIDSFVSHTGRSEQSKEGSRREGRGMIARALRGAEMISSFRVDRGFL